MKLSIVSGTYNRLPLLKKMVHSARDSLPFDIEYEFILIDGGSDDGTQKWCKEQPDVNLIEHGELRGAIAAFCDGAKMAMGEYVILSNDDVEFVRDSITRAIDYLDHVPRCGGVAFADNRPAPPFKTSDRYEVMAMPAMKDGRNTTVYYAQVGMFRRWLGNKVGWWGADDATFTAKTYGGDNYLSSGIWETGYEIHEVDTCRVRDAVYADQLRQINVAGLVGQTHPDSEAYYALYPIGAVIPDNPPELPTLPNDMRILYLPIFEPGHEIQREQKRGLFDALSKVGWVYEYDYLEKPASQLLNRLAYIIQNIQPDLMITQLHDADHITPQAMSFLRKFAPEMVVVNWNGDYWPQNLLRDTMLDLLREIDLQLIVNGDVLLAYENEEIPSAYWQVAYENAPNPPEVDQHDVVFLGTRYHDKRIEFESMFPEIAYYGDGWFFSKGNCLYDFDTGAAVYQNAKLSIGDNLFSDNTGFVSNRLFQALAAGGAMYMQQHVKGLDELTGFIAGKHYVEWSDFRDLKAKIEYYLEHDEERRKIARLGTRYCRRYHSFDARVKELFEELLPDVIN